jgi:hypothetical protein
MSGPLGRLVSADMGRIKLVTGYMRIRYFAAASIARERLHETLTAIARASQVFHSTECLLLRRQVAFSADL